VDTKLLTENPVPVPLGPPAGPPWWKACVQPSQARHWHHLCNSLSVFMHTDTEMNSVHDKVNKYVCLWIFSFCAW